MKINDEKVLFVEGNRRSIRREQENDEEVNPGKRLACVESWERKESALQNRSGTSLLYLLQKSFQRRV